MNKHDATELAYKNGYEKGKTDAIRKMQFEINKTLSALCKGDVREIHRIVDQIAQETIENDGW